MQSFFSGCKKGPQIAKRNCEENCSLSSLCLNLAPDCEYIKEHWWRYVSSYAD